MAYSPTPAVKEARKALAVRLQGIRKDAGLSGADLARAVGWHRTKVYKIEATTTAPTEADIRTWCLHCRAAREIPELISAARTVETMYVEMRRAARAGLKSVQEGALSLYERTERFRIYEPGVIPGLFQTPDYARVRMGRITEFYDYGGDVEQAVVARMAKKRFITPGRTFAVVLEEAALWMRIGPPQVMARQLEHLKEIAGWPMVSLGIIPRDIERGFWSAPNFWIFDNDRVIVETPTAELTVTQQVEVEMYAKAFAALSGMAQVGEAAAALIDGALAAL